MSGAAARTGNVKNVCIKTIWEIEILVGVTESKHKIGERFVNDKFKKWYEDRQECKK